MLQETFVTQPNEKSYVQWNEHDHKDRRSALAFRGDRAFVELRDSVHRGTRL